MLRWHQRLISEDSPSADWRVEAQPASLPPRLSSERYIAMLIALRDNSRIHRSTRKTPRAAKCLAGAFGSAGWGGHAWDFPVLHTLCGIRESRIARFGARGLIDGEIELDGNLVSRLMLSSGDVQRVYGYILRGRGTCMYIVRSIVVMMPQRDGLFCIQCGNGI